MALKVAPGEVGVICPYRGQVNCINKALPPLVECDTVDRFQGRDQDCIVLSLVRSNPERKKGCLLGDARRVNVAVTRAKRKLIIIGDGTTLTAPAPGPPPLLTRLLDLCKTRGWRVPLPPGPHSSPLPAPPESRKHNPLTLPGKSKLSPLVPPPPVPAKMHKCHPLTKAVAPQAQKMNPFACRNNRAGPRFKGPGLRRRGVNGARVRGGGTRRALIDLTVSPVQPPSFRHSNKHAHHVSNANNKAQVTTKDNPPKSTSDKIQRPHASKPSAFARLRAGAKRSSGLSQGRKPRVVSGLRGEIIAIIHIGTFGTVRLRCVCAGRKNNAGSSQLTPGTAFKRAVKEAKTALKGSQGNHSPSLSLCLD